MARQAAGFAVVLVRSCFGLQLWSGIVLRVDRRSGVDRSARTSVIGWREWAHLPELGVGRVKAKIDTGARTSALHAFGLEIVRDGEQDVAVFELHPTQRSTAGAVPVRVPIIGYRKVRPSTGKAERRPVVATDVVVGEHKFTIELTLTSRDAMGFRMLLGRRAISGRYLVDSSRSFLAGSSLIASESNS